MSAPATVVFVAQAPFVGGAERTLLGLAASLDRARYRPLVLVGHHGATLQALRADGIAALHVPLPPPSRSRPAPFLLSVARLALHLRRHRAALVHVNDAPAHQAASLAARLLRVPRLCHLHFTYPAAGLRWWLRWGFEQALFASQFAKRDAQAQCPDLFPEPRCAVSANGFAAPPPPTAEALRELRADCRLADADAIVGFVGRLIERKGVEEFLHMAAALHAQRPRCRFLIVGEDRRGQPSYRAAMQALAVRLGVADACRFLGFRDDVWPLLHLCDVVVMPSRAEPFGNVAVETAAAGRALVATRVGGIPEIVRDGETGQLVEPGDVPAMTTAVASLLGDPQRRADLGNRARADAQLRFGLSLQAGAVMDLYDTIVRRHRSASAALL
jgi:glycosyltransferase involved in cell wall biosynthesis